jgi:glutathione peroxidase
MSRTTPTQLCPAGTRRRLCNTALWLVLGAPAALLAAAPAQAATACPAVLNFTQPRLQDEKPVNLCDYAGQVVLVVNTASYCGYTPQYKSLESLAAKYRSRGLVVLGFPSNDFGGQEPGSNAEIAAFCENTFSVKFPMFAKSSVAPGAGRAVNPVFAALQQRSGQVPRWNFHKFLVSRSGDTVVSHGSAVDPQDPAFQKDLEKLLKANKD